LIKTIEYDKKREGIKHTQQSLLWARVDSARDYSRSAG